MGSQGQPNRARRDAIRERVEAAKSKLSTRSDSHGGSGERHADHFSDESYPVSYPRFSTSILEPESTPAVEEFMYEEGLVRARLAPEELEKILAEFEGIGKSRTDHQTWIDLKAMTDWTAGDRC